MRRLSSVFASVGVNLGKSETVEFTIEKEGVGSHGGITDDGEARGAGVDDTQAPLTRARGELDDVLLVRHGDFGVGVEREGQGRIHFALGLGHGEAETVVEDGVGGVGVADTVEVGGGAEGAEDGVHGVEGRRGQQQDVGT